MKHEDPTSIPDTDRQVEGTSRRTLVAGAAWTIPVIAAAAAAPLAAASTVEPPRNHTIESSFGVGWYPTTQGQTSSGALQYDATEPGQYLRVTDTLPGDVISGIYFDVLISTGWPAPTFTALPGSNPSWSTLAPTGSTEVVNGVTYNVYRSTYASTIIATGTVTDIPTNFYFRSSSPYYTGQTVQTRRFATVNSTVVTLVRNPANVNNTNVPLAQAPTP
ncbi:hypothetical protein HQQ81_16545 [Microbacteriaceae bacterium VKM Ac-2854]|nr:hypothetical protein [Microbacteriaceae bacterium VKM Ac-2854]